MPSADQFQDWFNAITNNIAEVIRGKSDPIHLLVLSLVCEGHVLIEDIPGVGKTTLGKALARSVDGKFGRVQFTPDLLPTDVTGMSVWNRSNETFEFRPGPIFADVLLADEINRASPKTQSALLEAMAERQVTSDGITHHMAPPFMVIATQNPIEHQGTYRLPEAQLDRFLMQVGIGYPSQQAEHQILETQGNTHNYVDDLEAVVTPAQVNAMTSLLETIHIDDSLRTYLLNLASATRTDPRLSLGLSTRGLLALQSVSRAQAAASGRQFVSPDDIKSLARVVIPHRLVVRPSARSHGATATNVVDEILATVPIQQASVFAKAAPFLTGS